MPTYNIVRTEVAIARIQLMISLGQGNVALHETAIEMLRNGEVTAIECPENPMRFSLAFGGSIQTYNK
jgi:hypothetical protein